MTIEERKLTPAGQGNLQQIKLGIPVVEALNRMAEDPMGENEKLLLRILEQNKDTEYGRKYGFANIHSIEEYQKKVPVSVYDDYAGYILRMSEDGEENLITSGKVVHYNKSSGTVGNPKRIPLTEEAFQVFQKYNGPYRMGLVAKELGEDWINGRNMSIAESIAEIQHVKSGVTYGALSVKMIGEFRPYLGMSFTSPDEAIYPESETNTRYLHARFGLMDQDLTNMAANFLGFLLEVLRYMEQHWELLVNDIEQGTIDLGIKMSEEVRSSLLKKIQPMPERAQELRGIFMQGFEEPIVPKLWPHAQFLTGVGSGGFKVYADKIKEKYMGEKIARYFTGINASEGMISVPYRLNDEKSVPVPDSMFYEFLPTDADDDFSKIVTIDQLETGKEYEVIVTNLSGFYRYRMRDAVKIAGKYKNLPILEFIGRIDQTVSIMGEKTTEVALRTAAEDTAKQLGFDMIDFTVYPDVEHVPPRYIYFMEIESLPEGMKAKEIRFFLERNLAKANPSMGDKRKQEKKLQKAQKQVPVKGKMLEPQPVNVLGKKYESKERCYKGLGITKKSVQNHMKKTSCMFEEAVVYCYEKKLEKQFEFRREIYKSYNACCTAYNLAQEYVAIKAKREKITRQEAMEKLLAQRESEKTI